MKEAEFFAACNPPNAWGANGKRAFVVKGRAVVAERTEVRDTRSHLVGLFTPFRIDLPLEGPLQLMVVVTWPYLKGESKAVVTQGLEVWKTTRPDGDNVMKSIKDVLQLLRFFRNDSQICSETIMRLRGSEPGIYIKLTSLPQESVG